MEPNKNELGVAIDFDKLLQESRDLIEMINENDKLGLKINEILKMFVHTVHLQNEKMQQINMTATDYKNKYETLKKEYDELQSDYNLIYEANERKSNLIQTMRDNGEL